MPLLINIRRLKDQDLQLKGKLPVSELELDGLDELVRARKPLRYDLTAQEAGDGCLVEGDLELPLECECARCLKTFEIRLFLPDWTVHFALEGEEKAVVKDDSVDLTPYIREDILLEFPQHPLCEADCAGLPNRADAARKKSGSSQTPGASTWAELNKLKF